MVIDRYVGKSIFTGTAIACFVLLSVFAFVDFVAQLDDVGTGDYGVVQAVIYVVLRLPQRLYELSPTILLLGGILSMGAMAANSELIVMRASGISTTRITRSVLQAGFIIAIAVALLGEYIAPGATRTAKTFRAEAMEEKLIMGGSNDVWARDGNRYVNVKQIMPDHQLKQVSVYELNEQQQLESITTAAQAAYKDNQWVLDTVKRSTLTPEGVVTAHRDHITMSRLILLELFSILELEPQDMSATELWSYSRYLAGNNLDDGEYMLSFWIKALTPFTCLVMLLVAMPIVFSTTPRSGGVGQRIMLAILIGVIYFVLARSINYLGLVIDIAPVISASLPMMLVALLSVYFLRKIT